MSQLTEAEKRDELELNMSLERLRIPNVTFEFITTQIAGKGWGVVAAMHIPRGALLLAETALFSVKNVHDPLSRPNQRSIKSQAPQFPQFQTLVSKADPPSDESRFETNNFQMGKDRRGGQTCGIFFQASRFNHSCVPNAYFAWNPELNNGQGQLTIFAIQDINPYQRSWLIIALKTAISSRMRARQNSTITTVLFAIVLLACVSQGINSEQRAMNVEGECAYSSNKDRSKRVATRENINKLIDNLKQEGLIYPQLADALGELGKLAKKELSVARAPSAMSAATYATDCRESALQIAREKLDLDVRCNGSKSPVVMEALEFIPESDH